MHPSPNPDFMRRAIALASENVRALRGGPFGAVVVRNGEVVAKIAFAHSRHRRVDRHHQRIESGISRAFDSSFGNFTMCFTPASVTSV